MGRLTPVCRGDILRHYSSESLFSMGRLTRVELATSCVTGKRSNQLSYDRHKLITAENVLAVNKIYRPNQGPSAVPVGRPP